MTWRALAEMIGLVFRWYGSWMRAMDTGRLLRLRAEMRLPGLAWLELSVRAEDGRTLYDQRAIFYPHGLLGHLDWRSISPFHGLVFGGMPRK